MQLILTTDTEASDFLWREVFNCISSARIRHGNFSNQKQEITEPVTDWFAFSLKISYLDWFPCCLFFKKKFLSWNTLPYT